MAPIIYMIAGRGDFFWWGWGIDCIRWYNITWAY